ncbi:hypothetical protein QAD02_006774 [Eretmocerus hayati]|uniref:Uncharacterized protein n=1 Tax=Eretmocerus hayati TaxID=131215 RepID=A0ACC2N447_9HYME|nr:hypothetical protein QAD02_006774 [Eretmocerus hayati]
MAGRVVVTLLVSLVALMSRVTAREFDYCYSYESDPYLLMGTKTAYQFVQGKNGLPPIPSCTPVQIWVLSRHGTRYPDRTTILQMSTLSKLRDQIIYNHDNRGNGRLCDADLGHLKSWQMNPRVNDNTADFLTIPQGEQDMRLLAKRLQSGFPELLRPNPLNINHQNYRFRSTQAQRTRASLDSFMEGLFNNRDAVPADISPPDDTLLRAAKNCPTWESSLERDRVDYESELFVNSYEYQNLLQNVSRRLGFLHRINNESIELMYDMCRYEKAWDVSRLSPWCSVFNKEEMKILEYHEDLHFFYYSGPGRDINRRLGCPLIKDMFNHFK